MGIPNRSRLLDYADHADGVDRVDCVETEPPVAAASAPVPPSAQEPRRSRLLEYVEADAAVEPEPPVRPGPRPGVPAYHATVFVPAHPRHTPTTDPTGAPALIPFITYELFEHPTDGTVALAFTTLDGLVAALGEAQPWVATSLGPLAEGVGELGVTVHVDPWIAPGRPNWQPADLAAFAREARR
ncbi:SAV_915 family protein [Streptomyces sp. NPDC059755]|uniref:SAV_915 family protein n=1 Tax=Streptomyces sp. NPDC059755 TaxID=3346934 RepID=UPI00365FAC58